MNFSELYWLIPSFLVLLTAVLVVLFGLFSPNKKMLLSISSVGVFVALSVSVLQWIYWDRPLSSLVFSGALNFDLFGIILQTIVLAGTLIFFVIAYRYLDSLKQNLPEYISLTLFGVVGMAILGASRELVTTYIIFELAALPLIVLPALKESLRGVEAAIKFLILSAISSLVLLFGIVLVYAGSGSTTYETILSASANSETSLVLAGGLLMVVGFGFKMAIVPSHMWIPDVYRTAPVVVSAFLSTISKTSAFAATLGFVVFGLPKSGELAVVVGIIALLTMTYGNFGALRQNNLKSLMAYSTIAHAGYMLIGVAVAIKTDSFEPVVAVLFYLAAYVVTNLSVFTVLLEVMNKTKNSNIEVLRGIGSSAPFSAFLVLVGVLSLLGFPPTAGFVAKLWVFGVAVGNDMLWLAIAGAINSFVSAGYYLKIVRTMYIKEGGALEKTVAGIKLKFGLPTFAMAIVLLVTIVLFGVVAPLLSTPLEELSNIFG